MITPEQSQKVLDFLRNQPHLVLATADKAGKPEAALVAFAVTDALELIIGTDMKTRKYGNISHNPQVAAVVSGENITVQYDGQIRELSGGEAQEARAALSAKHPESAKFLSGPGERTFKISPSWLRYFDVSQGPPIKFEAQLREV